MGIVLFPALSNKSPVAHKEDIQVVYLVCLAGDDADLCSAHFLKTSERGTVTQLSR